MDQVTIALAQVNPTVGDVHGNIALARRIREQTTEADLIVFPELFVSGYPPEDLVLKPFFLDTVEQAVRELATDTADGGPALIIGAPWRENDKCYNAILLLDGGEVKTQRFKVELPNYGVFDEQRVFSAATPSGPISFRGFRLGLMICEDCWFEQTAECLAETGAECLIVSNGSPYESDKHDQRMNVAVARVVETGLPLAFVNQVGGQDELVFDGGSFVLDSERNLVTQAPMFTEHVLMTRWTRNGEGQLICDPGPIAPPAEGLEATYQAMCLGLVDYVEKNGFPGVILGLSGGIDSALSAAVAVDALGADRVHCLMMPSPYTSSDSLEDAEALASLLGIRLDSVSIEPAMQAFDQMLTPLFNGAAPGVTEENIQSRSRGVTLMAMSNKKGHMVLSTGNKSEMSVGYATLYGDMCGGYSVLKDVYKTTVFALCNWRNQSLPPGAKGPSGRVIPERIITKPPTAELKPDQTDQDTLPPYDELDDMLQCLIEHEMGIDQIVARGHKEETVARVWRMLDRAEYKRRQAPPGVKLTSRAFGKDRRYPITNAVTALLT